MNKALLFIFTILLLSLIFAYLSSLIISNENVLALAYSLGIFVAMGLCGKIKNIKIGSFNKYFLLLLPIFIFVLLINFISEGSFPVLKSITPLNTAIPLILISIAAFFEEAGFRGYLYSQLKSLNWIKLNLIISTSWLVWHLPAFVVNYYRLDYSQLPLLIIYFLNFYLLGMILLWFRVKSKGILFPTLIHTFLNLNVVFYPNITLNLKGEILTLIVSIVFIFLFKFYRKPQDFIH